MPTSIDDASNELGGLSEKVIKCYTLFSSASASSRRETKDIAVIVDEKLMKIKNRASTILANNCINIQKDFSRIIENRMSLQSTNQSSYTEWLIIFYWCWFICYKISRGTLKEYSIFFEAFSQDHSKLFFTLLEQSNYLTKSLVFDILAQYFFLKNAFNNEAKVLNSIINNVLVGGKMEKFTILCNSCIQNFKQIFNSRIVRKATEYDSLDAIVDEFIDNTYLVNLPNTIKGYTLCNRIVMIKKLSSMAKDYKGINTRVTFTLLTMLHEFGHFLQRFELRSDYLWFEKSSPSIEGIGSTLMKKIFKKEPETINIEATGYILQPKNWNQSRKKFSETFNTLNFYSEERRRAKSPNQRRLKQNMCKRLDVLKLGGCKYSGRLQNREKVNI